MHQCDQQRQHQQRIDSAYQHLQQKHCPPMNQCDRQRKDQERLDSTPIGCKKRNRRYHGDNQRCKHDCKRSSQRLILLHRHNFEASAQHQEKEDLLAHTSGRPHEKFWKQKKAAEYPEYANEANQEDSEYERQQSQ
jgi:hypothetical protein